MLNLAEDPKQLALEPARVSGSRENGIDKSCRHSPRLLIRAESNQKLHQHRRGEDPEQAPCEILAPMDSPNPASGTGSDASAASPDGISAFIARVLNQLALSAWLPAAFLTAGVAILLQFRSARSANLLKAVQQLTVHPVQVLVIMIPLLVIAQPALRQQAVQQLPDRALGRHRQRHHLGQLHLGYGY